MYIFIISYFVFFVDGNFVLLIFFIISVLGNDTLALIFVLFLMDLKNVDLLKEKAKQISLLTKICRIVFFIFHN